MFCNKLEPLNGDHDAWLCKWNEQDEVGLYYSGQKLRVEVEGNGSFMSKRQQFGCEGLDHVSKFFFFNRRFYNGRVEIWAGEQKQLNKKAHLDTGPWADSRISQKK